MRIDKGNLPKRRNSEINIRKTLKFISRTDLILALRESLPPFIMWYVMLSDERLKVIKLVSRKIA
ncbi:hypothetical protein DJ531_06235 [Sulfolobus sp. A20-N-F6]|nr:hypothetical protein DJ531_06235 [Sulfolobus sp. A20-N-F6]TRM88055.1 hypothetical protein DJ521_02580 [Sulfolobus sp. E3]